jgi:hypothetical protein
VTVTGNTFSNSYHGVRFANDGSPATVPSNFVVNRNAFVGNSQADISLAGGTVGTLNGTCNWWGQASGPAGTQTDGAVTTSPFLASSNLMGGCPAPPPVVPAAVPGLPRLVSGVPGNKSAKVFWAAPISTGGSPITGYVVTPFKGGVAQTPVVFAATAKSGVVTGLKNKTTYNFKVAAKNAAGTGAGTATGLITAGAPGRPGSVRAAKGGAAGKLKVTFVHPLNNGAVITGYTAICTSSNGGALATGTRAKSPVGVSGATVGKKYACQVIAKNSRGSGPRSVASHAVTA